MVPTLATVVVQEVGGTVQGLVVGLEGSSLYSLQPLSASLETS